MVVALELDGDVLLVCGLEDHREHPIVVQFFRVEHALDQSGLPAHALPLFGQFLVTEATIIGLGRHAEDHVGLEQLPGHPGGPVLPGLLVNIQPDIAPVAVQAGGQAPDTLGVLV